MALLDFLKNKEEKEKAKEKKQAVKKTEQSLAVKETKKSEKLAEKVEKIETAKIGQARNFSYDIIKKPHISEKATNLAEKNKYTFKVYARSNKLEIKKSVEGIYHVDVLDVKIIKSPHKKRRLGKTEGFKKAFTKAVVSVKEGQKIEIF